MPDRKPAGRIRRLLVANRGEIAVRIIRAAHELGLHTIQVHSQADGDMLAARLAGERIEIGPSRANKSYLRPEAILDAARRTDADAIHPGYGFLAENAEFADMVEQAGLIFVGPSGGIMRTMGDKAQARKAAEMAGVPTVPGSRGVIADVDEALALAETIGYPVLLKATAGGGGRGIRLASNPAELRDLFIQAGAEARAAFGDPGLYLERFIPRARHIEVQVLGDGENVVHLFERECSLQRRRQKIWEEAPAANLDEDVRRQLCRAALELARAVRYRGAGTVEFLYDDERHAFYFIEMNTRIQVEHPVTEMVTGIDLVREMIRIAGGHRLSLRQEDIRLTGHAIECRINAEDPALDFTPVPGTVETLHIPGGPGLRFDTMLYPGYTIPPFYDSLLGKLIAWDHDRPLAVDRMARALREMRLSGVPTTLPLLIELTGADDVRAGAVHTGWLEEWLASKKLDLPLEKVACR